MPERIDSKSLVETIRSQFNVPELQQLCFNLDIPYDDLPAKTHNGKVRELVLYCQRHGRLPELAQHVAEIRPTTANKEPKQMPQPGETEKVDRTAKIWIPIIVAFIGLVGVIITVMATRPGATPTPESDNLVYPVTVRANDTGQPIEGAHILVETGGGLAPKNAYTDANGFVRVAIDASQSGKQGRVTVSAANYKRKMYDIDLLPDMLPDEIRLDPE